MSFIKNLFTNFNAVETAYGGIEDKAQNSELPAEIETVVIGGGLSGLSTAIDLAEAGRGVAVLEAKNIADGPSGRSGGQLWPGFPQSYSEMAKNHGENLAQSTWQMTHEALRTVHSRAALRTDKCDFHPGVLLTAKTEPQAEWIKKEYAALKEAGMKWVTFVTGKEIREQLVNTDHYLNGMLFKGEEEGQQYGHINPRKLTQTVAKLAVEKGAKLIENNPVQGLSVMEDGRYRISTPKGEVIAKNVVMATGADTIRPKGVEYDLLPNTHMPIQIAILATEPIPEKLAREMMPGDVCFCDAADIAMSFGRMIEDPDLPGHYRLIVGGDVLGQTQPAFDIIGIEKKMRTIFPQLDRDGIKIEKIWSGNSDLSRSAMPFIINPKEGFYATGGQSGQGMVNTTLYGSAIAEAIQGKPEKMETLKILNPEFYSSNPNLAHWVNRVLAWGQVAREFVPMVIESKREERAEAERRQSRRAEERDPAPPEPL